jgi:hypothetical protein
VNFFIFTFYTRWVGLSQKTISRYCTLMNESMWLVALRTNAEVIAIRSDNYWGLGGDVGDSEKESKWFVCE